LKGYGFLFGLSALKYSHYSSEWWCHSSTKGSDVHIETVRLLRRAAMASNSSERKWKAAMRRASWILVCEDLTLRICQIPYCLVIWRSFTLNMQMCVCTCVFACLI
jgi:hypothetical protein